MNFAGAGTTILANANTYAGDTTLTSGTLVVANGSGSATGNGTITLNGGVLANAYSTQVSSLIAAGAAGAVPDPSLAGWSPAPAPVLLAPGGLGNIGTLDVGGITTNSNMTIDFDLGPP